ncbi:MAG: hypothetical protein KKC71_08940 [Chloroflexi bacterium]|nr:hypothetical protein [Chloroflexota bacterium]
MAYNAFIPQMHLRVRQRRQPLVVGDDDHCLALLDRERLEQADKCFVTPPLVISCPQQ